MPVKPLKIGIIGAGLTGLTAGLRLLQAGHEVVICEAAPAAGGLAGTFAYNGTRLEKYYHHIFGSDLESIQLIKEMGLSDRLLWKETPMGMFKNNRVMGFSTPWDLLRFTPLSFFNRLRFGVVILYLAQKKNWQAYENVKAQDWLKKAFGRQAWDAVWGPLLFGKFGDYASEIGMPWFYSRVHTRAHSRDKSMTKESLGYLDGSFQVLHEALVSAIRERGGQVRLNERIKAVEMDHGRVLGWKTSKRRETLDVVLSTIAPPAMPDLLPGHLQGEYWDKLKRIEYIGNVCAILTLDRSLSPIYWMNVPDLASPFIAVIEHTNLIPAGKYGGEQVVYLSSYLPTSHPRYQADDDKLLAEFYAYLGKVIPAFRPEQVKATHIFHDPYAQPVIRAGFGQNLVPIASPIAGFYVANMAQIYPEDRGMSYSIRLGQQAAQAIVNFQPEQPAKPARLRIALPRPVKAKAAAKVKKTIQHRKRKRP